MLTSNVPTACHMAASSLKLSMSPQIASSGSECTCMHVCAVTGKDNNRIAVVMLFSIMWGQYQVIVMGYCTCDRSYEVMNNVPTVLFITDKVTGAWLFVGSWHSNANCQLREKGMYMYVTLLHVHICAVVQKIYNYNNTFQHQVIVVIYVSCKQFIADVALSNADI